MRVLVLNCYSRNALAVIHGLDPKHQLIGGETRKSSFLLCNPQKIFRHPRLASVVRYADPGISLDTFASDLIKLIQEHEVDAVYPTGTQSTDALSQCKTQVESETSAVAIVDDFEKLGVLTDKGRMYRLCLELDIPSPKSTVKDKPCDSFQDYDALNFPVVAKPRRDSGSRGLGFFDSSEDLRAYFSAAETPPIESYIVQEVVHGDIYDVSFVAKHGKPVSLYTQRRISTMYDFGGGGIINITTRTTEIMDYASKIAERVDWNGVCTIEFLRAKNGQYYLLDCNPKIWGTTQLSLESGINMVQQAFDVFTLETIPEAQFNYEKDLLMRWWFPDIAFSWIQRPRTPKAILRRVFKSLQRHGEKRKTNNLKRTDLRHLLGIALENLSRP